MIWISLAQDALWWTSVKSGNFLTVWTNMTCSRRTCTTTWVSYFSEHKTAQRLVCTGRTWVALTVKNTGVYTSYTGFLVWPRKTRKLILFVARLYVETTGRTTQAQLAHGRPFLLETEEGHAHFVNTFTFFSFNYLNYTNDLNNTNFTLLKRNQS